MRNFTSFLFLEFYSIACGTVAGYLCARLGSLRACFLLATPMTGREREQERENERKVKTSSYRNRTANCMNVSHHELHIFTGTGDFTQFSCFYYRQTRQTRK